MKFFLLLAACLAVAKGSTTPPPDAEYSRSDLNNSESLLSSLLQYSGYSETCVAGALDYCSSAQTHVNFPTFTEEVRGFVQRVSGLLKRWESPPRHCKDLLDNGDTGRGLREVYPYHGRPRHIVTVYCDHITDGGGWTVFQRRDNYADRQSFNMSWKKYRLGFGDLEEEFWMGLDLLNELASTTPQHLRIDLEDFEGGHKWAKYGTFHVGSPETNYRLTIGRYSGDAGDSLAYHNGSEFSTHDDDNDEWVYNCAQRLRGGWWYKSCHKSNLNGYQHERTYSASWAEGINWEHWRGIWYSLKRTSMMIRPAI